MRAGIKTDLPALTLRLLKEDDCQELYYRLDKNRAHLMEWMSWLGRFKSVADASVFIQEGLADAATGTEFHYGLFFEGGLAGVVSFHDIWKNSRCSTLRYWLDRDQTGKGLMSAALKALITHGFKALGFHRIQALVATGNTASQAVCAGLGLKQEGVLVEAGWLYDHFVDLTMNSILSFQWDPADLPNRP